MAEIKPQQFMKVTMTLPALRVENGVMVLDITHPDAEHRQEIHLPVDHPNVLIEAVGAEQFRKDFDEMTIGVDDDATPEFAHPEEPVEHRVLRAYGNGFTDGLERGAWGDFDRSRR